MYGDPARMLLFYRNTIYTDVWAESMHVHIVELNVVRMFFSGQTSVAGPFDSFWSMDGQPRSQRLFRFFGIEADGREETNSPGDEVVQKWRHLLAWSRITFDL